jgi:putative hydrolase of the HAD superfamily
MPYLLFDVDNTLYGRERGVFDRLHERMNLFLVERVGLGAEWVDAVRERLWREYGTTLNGLMHTHGTEPDEYLTYVHDVDLTDLLAPDAALRTALLTAAGKRIIFTNGPRHHARRVVELLGVADCFERIFALEDTGYVPKPLAAAYEAVLRALPARAEECTLVDDSPRNLDAARALGMRTVLVGSPAPAAGNGHVCIASVAELPLALGKLGGGK